MSAARPGVPAGPLERAPGGFVQEPERAGILAGIELGEWDRRVAPRGWAPQAAPTPGYLLRSGPYRWSRNPMYTGEATVWAGWALFYASPTVWAGLVTVSAAFATLCSGRSACCWSTSARTTGPTWRTCRAGCPALPGAPDPPISAGSGPTGIATTKQDGGERASPLIMTRRTAYDSSSARPRDK